MPAAAKTYVPESPRKTKAVYDAADNTVTVSAQAPKYTEFDWETYVQEELPYISYVLNRTPHYRHPMVRCRL